ncbi:MAG TPA: fibronectin type III domain-containing protein [Micromonosporaceae bacterium]|nr:fibronectin type III domain-containing protein [Micromonosporaceae bacterium]
MDPVLALDEDHLYVEPGGETRVSATVRNAGDLVEQYRLEVVGEAARWSQVVPRQVSVLPAGTEEKTVSIVFRPPPPPLSAAGDFPFGLRCVSLEDQERCTIVEGDITVGAVVGVQARLANISPSGRWIGRYRLDIDNTGSVPVRLKLDATDTRSALRFAVAPRELTVESGQTASGYVAVKPYQPMLRGKPVSHPFEVTYQHADEPAANHTGTAGRGGAARPPTAGGGATLAGVFEQRPVVNRGVIVACLVLVAVAVGAGALLLRTAGRPEPPASISGPPPPVALTSAAAMTPTSVQLLWERSPYATGYLVQQVSADGAVQASKEVTDRDQSALLWGELPVGKVCFRVLAVGTGGRSAGSDPLCATLAAPAVTPSVAASVAASGAPSAAAPGAGAPSAGRSPGAGTNPGGPGAGGTGTDGPAGTDPVRGAYVIYDGPRAIEDRAAQGEAEALVAKLQAAGIQARLIDSRDSKRVADGRSGLWVVIGDGYRDFQSAVAECNAHRDVAPNCYAFPPA